LIFIIKINILLSLLIIKIKAKQNKCLVELNLKAIHLYVTTGMITR